MKKPRASAWHARVAEIGAKWHPKEKEWLIRFREWLVAHYEGDVSNIIVYGSKARGDWTDESDVDVLLIVKDTAADIHEDIRKKGYELADHSAMAPSILIRSEQEWENRRRTGLLFHANVERDGVSVL